jgi:hypothetical protein
MVFNKYDVMINHNFQIIFFHKIYINRDTLLWIKGGNNLKKYILAIFIILMLIGLTGCVKPWDEIESTGTIKYINIWGWYIIDDEGINAYIPMNLPDEFMEHDIRVGFKGIVQPRGNFSWVDPFPIILDDIWEI